MQLQRGKTTNHDSRSVLWEIIRQFSDHCGGNGGDLLRKIRENHKPTELAKEACRLSAARQHLYFLTSASALLLQLANVFRGLRIWLVLFISDGPACHHMCWNVCVLHNCNRSMAHQESFHMKHKLFWESALKSPDGCMPDNVQWSSFTK